MASPNQGRRRKLEDTRLGQIPVIHVRGTHRVVGYTIVSTNSEIFDNILHKIELE